MKYTVDAFDNETEFLAFEVDLPNGCDVQLAGIMNWSPPQRGDEGYNLSVAQLAAIEALAGRPISDPSYTAHL